MLKNITLSAEEKLIRVVRTKALQENKTLNSMFRVWLAKYAQQDKAPVRYGTLMKKFSYANSGQRFSRDMLNER